MLLPSSLSLKLTALLTSFSTFLAPNYFNRSLFLIILFLTSCSGVGLNQISVKKIKNEATGEVEEYRSIKILEDEENNYFLDIKIPEGYESEPTQFGDFLTVYRFSKGKANQYTREGVLISKTNSLVDTIEDYTAWIDSSYRGSKGDPVFKDFSYGHEDDTDGFRVKTYVMKYIFPCSYMKAGAICFSGQKEIDVIKLFKTNKTVWAVEYTNLISPINDNNYEETVKKKLKEGEKVIENCCKITVTKKPAKDSSDGNERTKKRNPDSYHIAN